MRVLVVGAGIVGASVAYHLGLRGVEVVVADRGDRGQATAAGAGIIGPWLHVTHDPDWYRLASIGARYYPELAKLLAEDGEPEFGYAKVGGLMVAEDPADLAPALDLITQRQATAPEAVGEINSLAPGEARSLFPALAPQFAAIHVAGVSRVDGAQIRDALLRAASRHGVVRRTGSVEVRPGGALIDGVPESADAVVVASGAWSADLCTAPEVALDVRPLRGQIVHLRLPGVDTEQWPVVQPPGHHYMVAFPDSRVVVGATREPDAGFGYRVTAAGQAEVLAQALAIAPGLADATVLETRVGFRPVSGTTLPVLGTVTDGLVVATGMGPSGLTMGPYSGELAARLVLGEDPGMDLAAYAP